MSVAAGAVESAAAGEGGPPTQASNPRPQPRHALATTPRPCNHALHGINRGPYAPVRAGAHAGAAAGAVRRDGRGRPTRRSAVVRLSECKPLGRQCARHTATREPSIPGVHLAMRAGYPLLYEGSTLSMTGVVTLYTLAVITHH